MRAGLGHDVTRAAPGAVKRRQAGRGALQVRLIPNPMSDTSGGARGPVPGLVTSADLGMTGVTATPSTAAAGVSCPASRSTATQPAWPIEQPTGPATLPSADWELLRAGCATPTRSARRVGAGSPACAGLTCGADREAPLCIAGAPLGVAMASGSPCIPPRPSSVSSARARNAHRYLDCSRSTPSRYPHNRTSARACNYVPTGVHLSWRVIRAGIRV